MAKLSLQGFTLYSRVFLGVLSFFVACTSLFQIGELQIQEMFRQPSTQLPFLWMRRWLDFGWVLTLFVAAYWCCIAEEGMRYARRIFLIALGFALLLSNLLGFLDFGTGFRVYYTETLGMKLPGGVSMGTILLFAALLLLVRSSALCVARNRPTWVLVAISAALLGSLVWAVDWILAKPRAWWLWGASDKSVAVVSPPWTEPLLWAIAGSAFVLCAPRPFSGRETAGGWIALGNVGCVLLLALLARWIRG